MKKIGFVLVIGLFLLGCVYVFAQEEDLDVPGRGLIKGKVTDTQIPRANNLADAVVTVESDILLGANARNAKTDQAGNYEVSNLPPGEYVVTVSKTGFDDSYDYVTVTLGGEAFHDVRLYKTDPPSFSGKLALFHGILLLCIIVAIIYIMRRRSSGKTQDT